MRTNHYRQLPLYALTLACVFLFGEAKAQSSDTVQTINFPLLHEDLSLYHYAVVRTESDKKEVPPADITKQKFQPAKEMFATDELHFADSIKTFWIKFQLANNQASDTTIALIFPSAVSKAVLYKAEDGSMIQIGKTGFLYSVLARNVSYQDNRIDLVLKGHSKVVYFIQIILYNGIWMGKMPALENFTYAETRAFQFEKEVNRPTLLWLYFFTGVFCMFFVFGLIKYLMLGKDKAYLYYSLMGLCAALLMLAQAEYPPLELRWFENLRGVEFFDVIWAAAVIMQGLFILEVLQLKRKHPRITRAIKWYFVFKFLLYATNTTIWFVTRHHTTIKYIEGYDPWLLMLLMLGWVVYLAMNRKGFYRYLFLGAVTIFIALILVFIVLNSNLLYLLPAWFGADQRGRAFHIMTIALVIDMLFYFTGLAYRDRQVENDKVLFQEELKVQKLESEKTKAELLHQASELEMQALRAQMNPHFIFNCLNAINHFILNNEPETASGYLTKFSRLIRTVLHLSQKSEISLQEELDCLNLYIQLEQLRFQKHFQYTIQCADTIDPESIMIPPMLIQPFVENAIWHGLMQKVGIGKLSIELTLNNELLCCTITDNGIGRSEAAMLKSKSAAQNKSLGMKITANRLQLLNEGKNEEYFFTVIDLRHEDGESAGTKVIITIPVKLFENLITTNDV